MAMAASFDSACWVCARKTDFSIREWPDGSVVFDDASGQLHCLTPVAGEVLALILESDGLTGDALAESLLGETPTPTDSEMMENMLVSLASMNLIDRRLATLSVKQSSAY
jgi:PqqD family protein of HPr-rel-A system